MGKCQATVSSEPSGDATRRLFRLLVFIWRHHAPLFSQRSVRALFVPQPNIDSALVYQIVQLACIGTFCSLGSRSSSDEYQVVPKPAHDELLR
ncbi:hypothetical protein BJX68DRAFT_153823 [Aspergillus pseudodeflectus]|uniref:Uncharacterized protein n=1 Tax=Aspergillus pseudodeflectus TaxID=176178 RepID=A0ABR4JUY0_9EURO